MQFVSLDCLSTRLRNSPCGLRLKTELQYSVNHHV